MNRSLRLSCGLLLALSFGLGLSSCTLSGRATACQYNGARVEPGTSFPSADGCNTCSCDDDGAVSCTLRACFDGGVVDAKPGPDVGRDGNDVGDGATEQGESAPAACSLENAYRFYDDGGLRAYYDDERLAPARTHTLTRKGLVDAPVECTREIPCSASDQIDLAAVQRAIAHPDVIEALAKAQRPHYGNDTRPVDGTVWIFERSDGRGFSLGAGNVPAGLRALETVLRQLTSETRAAPQCAQLRP